MASTRTKNTQGEYLLQQRQHENIINNSVSPFRNYAYDNALPAVGILTGHMPHNAIASNGIQIESQLFGIGATDLTKSRPIENPQNYHRREQSFFERPSLMLPDPLVIRKGQRPIIP